MLQQRYERNGAFQRHPISYHIVFIFLSNTTAYACKIQLKMARLTNTTMGVTTPIISFTKSYRPRCIYYCLIPLPLTLIYKPRHNSFFFFSKLNNGNAFNFWRFSVNLLFAVVFSPTFFLRFLMHLLLIFYYYFICSSSKIFIFYLPLSLFFSL